jgi:hypothetical protein
MHIALLRDITQERFGLAVFIRIFRPLTRQHTAVNIAFLHVAAEEDAQLKITLQGIWGPMFLLGVVIHRPRKPRG